LVARLSSPRGASTLTAELERLDAKFAAAGEASSADLETYRLFADSLSRLLEAVGLQRRQRDVVPDPLDYILEQASAGKSFILLNSRCCHGGRPPGTLC
jgi:hypothetical protein